MPCQCGGYNEEDSPEEHLKAATRMLCWVLEHTSDLSQLLKTNGELRKFWKKHQDADCERRTREQEKARVEEVRKKALKRLTPEEIRALKIP